MRFPLAIILPALSVGWFAHALFITSRDKPEVQKCLDTTEIFEKKTVPIAKPSVPEISPDEAIQAPDKAPDAQEKENIADVLSLEGQTRDKNPDRKARESEIFHDVVADADMSQNVEINEVKCAADECVITVSTSLQEEAFFLIALKFLKMNRAVNEKLTITTDSFAPRAVNISTKIDK
jgi:hypothetical protein